MIPTLLTLAIGAVIGAKLTDRSSESEIIIEEKITVTAINKDKPVKHEQRQEQRQEQTQEQTQENGQTRGQGSARTKRRAAQRKRSRERREQEMAESFIITHTANIQIKGNPNVIVVVPNKFSNNKTLV